MSVDLDVDSLDRLVRASDGLTEDQIELTVSDPMLMITTTDGQRLRLDQSSEAHLVLVTAWARIEVPVAEVLRLAADSEGGLGWMVALHDGSRFAAYLGSDGLRLPSQLFGELELSPSDLVAISRVGDDVDPDAVLERPAAYSACR